MQEIEDLNKAITSVEINAVDLLRKSHVKGYTRTTASGNVVNVQEHEDSRKSTAESLASVIGGNHQHSDGSGVSTAYYKGSNRNEVENIAHKHLMQQGYKSIGAERGGDHYIGHYEHPNGNKATLTSKKKLFVGKSAEGVNIDIHSGGGGKTNDKKKDAPPQADSNRHKWDNLDDDEHPREAMRRIGSAELGKVATGKTDIRQRAKEELAARGVDEHGEWLGFDKAAKHHGTEGAKQKDDEIDGHFQTVHHKILGAIASGYTDAKRLASEELANRGHDHDGKWIGFDKADKLHGTGKK